MRNQQQEALEDRMPLQLVATEQWHEAHRHGHGSDSDSDDSSDSGDGIRPLRFLHKVLETTNVKINHLVGTTNEALTNFVETTNERIGKVRLQVVDATEGLIQRALLRQGSGRHPAGAAAGEGGAGVPGGAATAAGVGDGAGGPARDDMRRRTSRDSPTKGTPQKGRSASQVGEVPAGGRVHDVRLSAGQLTFGDMSTGAAGASSGASQAKQDDGGRVDCTAGGQFGSTKTGQASRGLKPLPLHLPDRAASQPGGQDPGDMPGAQHQATELSNLANRKQRTSEPGVAPQHGPHQPVRGARRLAQAVRRVVKGEHGGSSHHNHHSGAALSGAGPMPTTTKFMLSLPELECATGHALGIYGDLEQYVGESGESMCVSIGTCVGILLASANVKAIAVFA